MNKNKKTYLGLGALALILGSLGAVGIKTEAYRGDMSTKGPNFSEARHADMVKAFETNDYDVVFGNLIFYDDLSNKKYISKNVIDFPSNQRNWLRYQLLNGISGGSAFMYKKEILLNGSLNL